MKKAKLFGTPLSFLASMMPARARLALLSWLTKHLYHAPGLVFPYSLSTPPKILIMLPEDPLAALHQISGCCALAAHFKNARITVLCQRLVTPFFRTLAGIQDFIEYDCSQRYLFSKEFVRIGKEAGGEHYDVCIMLDHSPHMAFLHICGRSAAPVRIGFAETGPGTGGYPFLNMQVRPSPQCTYSTDQGLLLVSTLGVRAQKKTRWIVAKESIAEVSMLLSEMKVDPSSRLIGIDAGFFMSTFGAQWAQSLIDTLKDVSFDKPQDLSRGTLKDVSFDKPQDLSRGTLKDVSFDKPQDLSRGTLKDLRQQNVRNAYYLFCYEEPDEKTAAWLGRQDLPVFSNLPASRCAALIYKSEFIVAGATVLFELADALRKPVVGIFSDSQFDAYCRESDTTHGIRYADAKRPDPGVIDAIGKLVAASLTRPFDVP
jgi:ADP-heptose:LPS heptosyltransferase